MATSEITIPRKLVFLLSPSRYKIARGGRGSAKSWTFARVLLAKGIKTPLRVLCTREIQQSIKQSVHQLLKDQIALLNYGRYYDVKETEICGTNGTLFSFVGLSSLTVDTIKSFEGYDVCWVEEGQVISKSSWDILVPTIRKDGSEIWISYNPDLETDETHKRFTLNPPPDTVNVEINWRDNPWFNDLLNQERLYCQQHDPDNYDNIWEGKCRPAVEGAIYHREVQAIEESGRICNIPHDPMLLTHVVVDLGWDDSLAIGLIQRHLSEIRVIEYIEVSHTTLPTISAELRLRPYVWGRLWLPHDGFNASLNSNGKSTYDIMTALGWTCAQRHEITEMGVEDGIRHTRSLMGRMWFDSVKCHAAQSPISSGIVHHTDLSHKLIECIKRYRRNVNRKTETTNTPLKDIHAHGADMLRYVACNADKMDATGKPTGIRPQVPRVGASYARVPQIGVNR